MERYSPFAGQINPFTGAVVPGPPDDRRVVYIELDYRFPAGRRPAELVITPPLGDRDLARVNLGFTLKHRGVQVVDFKTLGGPVDLILDWDDPW